MASFTVSPTRRGFLGGVALALLTARVAGAAIPPHTALAAADQADLDRIQAYLNGIKTVTGKFEQTNPDGSVETGTVWLSRPGKMRFEYDPPAQLLIVCDGDFIEVNDKSLDDIQFVPVKDTPAWLILRDGIALSGDVTVTNFERGPKTFRVTAVQSNDQSDSSLTMVFSDDPLALRQWTVTDPQGRGTKVALVDLRDAGNLTRDLFVLPDRNKHKRTR
ncbi:MAG: outer membrane lipoprotein carrier protein LolA [Aliidongia sp.]